MSDPPVLVYTTNYCGYCSAAKALLSKNGIPFREIDVTTDPAQRAWLVEATGRTTVPQIFVRGEPVGGFTDLRALHQSGELRRKLDAVPEARP